MILPNHMLPTTVVGSYPQPEWLVDRAMLSKSVPRTRMHAMWRLPQEHLQEAQDDATIVAIRDLERAGIDIVTDGEIRRESYSNRFATALDGIDADNPAMIASRSGIQTPVPRVVGKVSRSTAVERRIPILTTISGVEASIRAMRSIQTKGLTVKTLQEYHLST